MRWKEMDIWERLLYSVVVAIVLFLVGWCLTPKTHQGYYMLMSCNNSFTTYRVMNDWDNYPDNTAYRTATKEDAFDKFGKMRVLGIQ